MAVKPLADAERKGARFWAGDPGLCDFSTMRPERQHDIMAGFVDGRTRHGQWANMCAKCWPLEGCGQLGTGRGQRYEPRDIDGRVKWLKVAG